MRTIAEPEKIGLTEQAYLTGFRTCLDSILFLNQLYEIFPNKELIEAVIHQQEIDKDNGELLEHLMSELETHAERHIPKKWEKISVAQHKYRDTLEPGES